MNSEEVLKFKEDQENHLVGKGVLILKVSVKTREQSEELLRWMYATEKPMKSELLSISWDQVPISSDVVRALSKLQTALMNTTQLPYMDEDESI